MIQTEVAMAAKKLGLIQRIFGSNKFSIEDEKADEKADDARAIMDEFKRTAQSRRHTVDVEMFRGDLTDEELMAAAVDKYSGSAAVGLLLHRGSYEDGVQQEPSAAQINRSSSDFTDTGRKKLVSAGRNPPTTCRRAESAVGSRSGGAGVRQRRSGANVTAAVAKARAAATGNSVPEKKQSASVDKSSSKPKSLGSVSGGGSNTQHELRRRTGGSIKRRSIRKERKSNAARTIDTTRPLTFPTTPEKILEYHKARPFLDENEEWLMVELNEYECLVDSLAIVKIIAKHSKFFEVEPDELWEEFFEFVDDVPSYDEVINFDVWQEFRDKRYAR